MPLTEKGEAILGAMKKEYGAKKGEKVFYASRNKGVIGGIDSERLDVALAHCVKIDAAFCRGDNQRSPAYNKGYRDGYRLAPKAPPDDDAEKRDYLSGYDDGAKAREKYLKM